MPCHRFVACALVFFLCSLSSSADVTAKPQIKWHTAAMQALEQGVEQNKPTVVYFGERWVDWCSEMEDKVFPSEQLQALADKAVFVNGRPSQDEGTRKLAERFEIRSFPTILVLAPDKKKLAAMGRINGLLQPDELAKALTDILNSTGPQAESAAKFGPLFSETSNLCPPGDELCEYFVEFGGLDLNSDLPALLKLPGDKPTEPVAEKLSLKQIGESLQQLGYETELRDNQYYYIAEQDDHLAYKMRVQPSMNGRVIYVTALLSQETPLEKVPPVLLGQLLARNSMIGPAYFEVTDGGQLRLTVSVINTPATEADLKFAIRQLKLTALQEVELWKAYAKHAEK